MFSALNNGLRNWLFPRSEAKIDQTKVSFKKESKNEHWEIIDETKVPKARIERMAGSWAIVSPWMTDAEIRESDKSMKGFGIIPPPSKTRSSSSLGHQKLIEKTNSSASKILNPIKDDWVDVKFAAKDERPRIKHKQD